MTDTYMEADSKTHISGSGFINGQAITGAQNLKVQKSNSFCAYNPKDNSRLPGDFPNMTYQDIVVAANTAENVFTEFSQNTSYKTRALLLENIALELENNQDIIIERANLETGLPSTRLNGELIRTSNQLKLFAKLLTSSQGKWLDATIEHAQPGRVPTPKPDLRMINIPIGPVAIFGASNFPLAFSVLGSDTASALAAGCPVIIKAHQSHPGTSELCAKIVIKVLKDLNLPLGIFALLFSNQNSFGADLVSNNKIKAVAFTGSKTAGLALAKVIDSRAEPIPFYGELGSTNPVFLLPSAFDNDTKNLAQNYITSLTMSAGQFCTNPGLLFTLKSEECEKFIAQAASLVSKQEPQVMLTKKIHQNYTISCDRLKNNSTLKVLAKGQSGDKNNAQAMLFEIKAENWLKQPELAEEIFGPAGIIIKCSSIEELYKMSQNLHGNLTTSLHFNPTCNIDREFAKNLLTILQLKSGRVIANGWPTGVEVTAAMMHGGPFPASTNSHYTSVGTRAIERFVRPICYQGFPEWLLPEALQDKNPLDITQEIL